MFAKLGTVVPSIRSKSITEKQKSLLQKPQGSFWKVSHFKFLPCSLLCSFRTKETVLKMRQAKLVFTKTMNWISVKSRSSDLLVAPRPQTLEVPANAL